MPPTTTPQYTTPQLDSLTINIRNDPNNPILLIEYATALAQLLGQHSTDENGQIITFGSIKVFSSLAHVVNSLYDVIGKILSIDPTSLKSNLKISSLVNSGLPYYCRMTPFSKMCLERALLFQPNSSKVLTRIGFFYLGVEKNPKTAKSQFEKAYSLNPMDFKALVAILYTCFNDVQQHLDFVGEILKRELCSDHWNNVQKAELYFIKGMYCFLFEFKIGIANAWMNGLDLSVEGMRVCFESLPSKKRHYRIPEELCFNLPNLSTTLKTLANQIPNKNQNKLKKIRNMIKSAGRLELKSEKKEEEFNRLYWNWKSELYTGNPVLVSLLGGSDADAVGEAYKVLGIGVGVPKSVVFKKYKEFFDEQRTQPEIKKINQAFATLWREFERKKSRDN